MNGLWREKDAVSDETFPAPTLRLLHDALPNLDHRPAVVLFHYTRRDDNPQLWINREPVYNTDTAWPDDAPVIRAHDLGPVRDREIFEYFAAREPERYFYTFDIATGQSEELGTAADLARRPKPPE